MVRGDSRAANRKKVVQQGGGGGGEMSKGRNEDLTVIRRKGLLRVWKNREGYLEGEGCSKGRES